MIEINIIYPREIEYIKPIRLNKNGKIIGFIVRYNHKVYYLSRRAYTEEQDHVFRMFNGGFGLDRALYKSILKGESELYSKIDGVIILYDGKKEKRYFYASLDDWFDHSENYSTSKEKNNTIETYGEQKILRGNFWKVLGLHPDDYEAKEMVR